MARFNRFGATYTQVIALFPGTDVTDFDDGGSGGQAKIESALDRITREVAGALTPEVYTQITEVDCQEVVRYATDGQTTATLGRPPNAGTSYLIPAIAGSLHLWEYPSAEALGANGAFAGVAPMSDAWYRKPAFGINEVSGYALTAATGAITGLSLGLGNRLFASYTVDVDSASFSLPSVADLVLLGAAAELGARLYSEGSSEWKLVEDYQERYRGRYVVSDGGAIAHARLGDWIPDELRSLRYWNEVERKSDQVSSVRLYRG